MYHHTNCYNGRGATEVLDHNVHTVTGEIDRADIGTIAVAKCRMRCEARADECTAFTVQPTPQSSLHCWLRKYVVIDECDNGPDARRFYTFLRAPAAT